MTTAPINAPTQAVRERLGRPDWRSISTAVAIATMWIVVLLVALDGDDIVNSTGGGTDQSSVPASVAVALFATIATFFVARYGLRDDAAKRQ